MIGEKYLPIGTIVLLNFGTKKLMITGFGPKDEKSGKIYDYMGCLYPEGIITTTKNYLFNHMDIMQIISKGYEDEESKEFFDKIKNATSQNNFVDDLNVDTL